MEKEKIIEAKFTTRTTPKVMFTNCGHQSTRLIQDCERLNYISAGQGKADKKKKKPYFFSNQIRNLIIGDILCVYRNKIGYVGLARVISKPMPIKQAFLGGKKVTNDIFSIGANMFNESDDPGYEECLVEVKWLTSVHTKDDFASGVCFGQPYFAKPLVTCTLDSQQETKNKLEEVFRINFEQLLLNNEPEIQVDQEPSFVIDNISIVSENLFNDEILAEEIPAGITEQLFEGSKKTIVINAYERNPKARKLCIDHWKAICAVCEFDFEKNYGEIGKGFIHVHHLTPVSKIGEQYEVDPINDLRPVCPNCHSMLHRQIDILSIEQLKLIVAAHQ